MRPRTGSAIDREANGMIGTESDALARGADGRLRCFWAAGSPEYAPYHDQEWGRPLLGDDELFERLCLEGFQSGLSWLIILRKRESFRAAFADFDIATVAAYGEGDVQRLLADSGIVRNRRKIEAAVNNARLALELVEEHGSLARFLWSFRPERQKPIRRMADFVVKTPEAEALAQELRRRGFRFLGPTTLYAGMQAYGVVNDHVVGCCVRDEVEQEQRAAVEEIAGRSRR
jgi:DNA-3-methyladenine glycosylase I